MNTYTSEDFVAFLAYAGPPPRQRLVHNIRNASYLEERIEYVNKCDEFCVEYFKEMCKPSSWGEFYTEFLRWYLIRQEMQDEIQSKRSAIHPGRGDL